jgi:Protein of unknown function (DUF3617)
MVGWRCFVVNKMLVKIVATSGLLAGFFQTPMAPPMKLGLWETTASTQMQMPGMQMAARSTKVRSCATAESWNKAFGQARQNKDCTPVNEKRTATSYSFDLSCSSSKATGHAEMDFGNGTTGHGTMHMVVDADGKTMTMDTSWESKYLGADCGSVAPGSPEIIQ